MPKSERNPADQIRREIAGLGIEVPEEVGRKIEEQIAHNDLSGRVGVLELTRELMAVAPELKGRMRLALFMAIAGELLSFVSYFFCAYAAAWLLGVGTAAERPFAELLTYGGLALLALLLHLALCGGSSLLSHRSAFAILHRLRVRLFEKLGRVPQGYLVETPVGRIKVVIQERVAELEDWVAHVMPELPSRILHPVLALALLFALDWRVALAVLAPLPLALLGMSRMMHKYKGRMTLWVSAYANMADQTADYVRGIPIIKAFRQSQRSYGRFAEAVRFYHSSTMSWWKQSWFGSAMVLSAFMSPLLLALPLAFSLHAAGQLGISGLLLALILPLAILPQAFALMMSFELFQMASNSWLDVRELLHLSEQERPPAEARKQLDPGRGVAFEEVSFSYRDGTEVLHRVSFTAEKGCVTAIVGPSGSGKSTLARLIAGFWDPDSGRILLGGADTREIPFAQLAENISYVAQDNYLFDCSIRDNIRLGKADAEEAEIVAAARSARCDDFIRALPKGYDSRPGDAGGALSGGERQRIALARALLKPAEIVVLDEATAYADPENEALIQEALSELVRGKSLLVIAHRLHTVRHAHKIIVLDKGRIAAQGRHEELVKSSPLYRRLWAEYSGEVFEDV